MIAAYGSIAAPGPAINDIVLMDSRIYQDVFLPILEEIADIRDVNHQLRVQTGGHDTAGHVDLAIIERFNLPVVH